MTLLSRSALLLFYLNLWPLWRHTSFFKVCFVGSIIRGRSSKRYVFNFSLLLNPILCPCWRRQEHLCLSPQKVPANQLRLNLLPPKLRQNHRQHQGEARRHRLPHLHPLVVMLQRKLNLVASKQNLRQVEDRAEALFSNS